MWIRNSTALFETGDGQWVGRAVDLEISGSVISQVVDRVGVSAVGPEDVDGDGLLAVPGLVNLHHHSNDAFFRGRHERLPLELYMLHAGVPWGLDSEPSLRMLEVRTLLASAEMLLSGTTAVLDDCYPAGAVTKDTLDAIAGAYSQVGLRATVAVDIADLAMPATVVGLQDAMTPEQLEALPPNHRWRADLDAVIQWAGGWEAGLVRGSVAASAPQRCSDEALVAIAQAAAQMGRTWSTHALETRTQALTGYQRYGASIIEHCSRLGILDERLVLAHCVWVNDNDIEILASSGATVAHNPTSNLRLGSGIAPVGRMLLNGVRVGLGTDGIASNDALNMLLEMRLAASLQNVVTDDWRTWLRASDALRMATSGGARALGVPGLGTLAVGGAADIVLYRALDFAFTPLADWARNLVFAEHGRSVHTVIVGGRLVVEEGKLATIDLEATLAEARALAEEFFARNARSFERVNEFEAAVAEVTRCAMSQALDGESLRQHSPKTRPMQMVYGGGQ